MVCHTCPYHYLLRTAISTTQQFATRKPEHVSGEDDEVKFGNKCTVQCPRCQNNEALFMELQTRSADEPMTIFYRCTACKFNWKE